MSRRKDRERFESMKRLNPDYHGFRGHGSEPSRPGNVPRGIALEQGDSYVCSRCAQEDTVPQPVQEE